MAQQLSDKKTLNNSLQKYATINNNDFNDEGLFEKISEEWLVQISPQLKASSIAKYSNILNLYLLPRFAKKHVCEISRNEILLMSRELMCSGGKKSKGLSPKTIKSVISLMKIILEYASREKGILTADIRNIFIKQPQKPMRILSITEQHRLSRYLCNNVTPCNLGILVSLYSGLRIGEVCALKWEDINIKEQYIFVHQTMQRIQIHDDMSRKTKIVIQSPKSDHSIRKIPLPNEILKKLMAFEEQPDAYLLSGKPNIFVEPRSMENNFKSVVKKCNISNVSFHVLRHTFATRCIELGFDPKSLSEILGHSSVNITLNRYVHPSMELKQKT